MYIVIYVHLRLQFNLLVSAHPFLNCRAEVLVCFFACGGKPRIQFNDFAIAGWREGERLSGRYTARGRSANVRSRKYRVIELGRRDIVPFIAQ